MNRVSLDTADAAVKDFFQSLPIQTQSVELESEGRVICTVTPPDSLSQPEKAVLLERGRELVRRSRDRNVGIPEEVIEREVRHAVEEVRQRST